MKKMTPLTGGKGKSTDDKLFTHILFYQNL